jgi:sulfur-carrier protein
MKVTLRLFASLREAVGVAEEIIEPPWNVLTVGDLRAWLMERGAPWAEALSEARPLRMACNQAMCSSEEELTDGCEVAFFPPVTGG